jgi:hypothetical protein
MRTIKAKMSSPPAARQDGAGIDHDMWVAWVDAQDNDVNVAHASCPIPLDRFAELLAPMTNGARATLYKALIMEFYGARVVPLAAPRQPSGLSNLLAWDAYLDEKDAYDAELAARTAQSATLAAEATAWIEGLAGFEGWPFPFVLQEGD